MQTMIRFVGGVVVLLVAAVAAAHNVEILDDCAPNADWGVNGCLLEEGDVTRGEFTAELLSSLADAVIGHQAWRNDPAYLKIASGETVHVKNKGGRNHTFTEVANFGGGSVPALSFGLDLAPECANVPNLPPDESIKITGLSVGNHRFQCCRHPWMRALIKVLDAED
jgi:plastocyanin